MRGASTAGPWREARRLLRRHRGPLAGALLLVAINRIAAFVLPAASKFVVDEVIGRGRTNLLPPVVALVCVAIVIEAAAAFGVAQVSGVAGLRASATLRQELQARALGLPLRHIDGEQSGALAARVLTDSEQIRYLIGNGSVQLAASLLTASLALGLLFWLDSSLTLGVFTVVILCAFGVRGAFPRIADKLEGILRRQSELTGRLGQVFGGARVVKAYAAERQEAYRFAGESHLLVRQSVNALRSMSLLHSGGALATGALGVLLLVTGVGSVTTGDMTLGSYVMYVWLTGYLLGPVIHVAASTGELGKATAALRRIAELRDRLTEDEQDQGCHPLHRIAGNVEFQGVHYAYDPHHPVLKGITLDCPAGSTTALIGPNGSGKSTLCHLILAYDRPTAGRILIDGKDLASLHRRSYRLSLGVVLQDDVLFDGTIADSIRYGRPRASLAEVEAAGRLAHCDEFVAHLADGYSTRVGERGVCLSAGQRQRVAIARAFLVDPRILVLDEATSNLDAESERLIVDALRFLRRGRTTFIIAHRLSTIRGADQVVVLDRGTVVDRRVAGRLFGASGHDVAYGRRLHSPGAFVALQPGATAKATEG